MSEKQFSEVTVCGHCGNASPMAIVAEHSQVKTLRQQIASDEWVSWDEGAIIRLLECPSCFGVSLTESHFHSQDQDEYDDLDEYEAERLWDIKYPQQVDAPRGLPSTIEKAYQAAQKVATIDANACGVLLGRVLDVVCDDRNAQGDTLNQRLGDLATKGEIPGNLVDVANGLRQLRNIGAHANLGELEDRDIPVLDSLCRAILEYVYSAPHIAQEARSRLDELRST
ncbi:MAG: DUF4145 domain-containing protein [Planctomycetes bacterium]|nr:DUF4145 domain-containing protein [Planctomycetota bacterium]